MKRFVLAACALLFALPAHADEGGWQRDTTDQGVTVYLHDEPGRGLPVFRGVGMVDATIYDILAVLDDATRYTEWMADCHSAKVLKKTSDYERTEYNRTKAPWPVSDRDVVIRSTVEANVAKREVWARFQQVAFPGWGPIDGVVRMPRLKGYYRLEVVDATHTRVTYEVDADPGGMIPDWVARRAQRVLPIDTIVGLRKQARKTRGRYEEFMKKFDPARGGAVPDAIKKG